MHRGEDRLQDRRRAGTDAAEQALAAAEKALAVSPGGAVATDEETKEMLDGVFGESAVATDEEVAEALDEVFNRAKAR